VIRFGPAGWDYPDWRGRVYPKPAPRGFDPLAYLARWFDTVEVNSTFYRPARPEVARAWCERVSDRPRFRFTAKLWRRLTHEREAYGAEEVAAARGALDAMAEAGRLGAVLVQFPGSFKRESTSLEWLRDLWTALAGLPLVLEVRHASWNAAETYAELAERGIGFVNLDQPLFKRSIAPSSIATSRVGYVRVHGRSYRNWFREQAGRDERYDYLYSHEEIREWVERIRLMQGKTKEIFIIANNHYRGQAAANALEMMHLMSGRQVEIPDGLVKAYPRLAPIAARMARPGMLPL
jgi:uncharacterized protein YecE (DUF72 family)